jgi:hypothetical protein
MWLLGRNERRDVLPMTDKQPKRHGDPNQFAKSIMDIARRGKRLSIQTDPLPPLG